MSFAVSVRRLSSISASKTATIFIENDLKAILKNNFYHFQRGVTKGLQRLHGITSRFRSYKGLQGVTGR